MIHTYSFQHSCTYRSENARELSTNHLVDIILKWNAKICFPLGQPVVKLCGNEFTVRHRIRVGTHKLGRIIATSSNDNKTFFPTTISDGLLVNLDT